MRYVHSVGILDVPPGALQFFAPLNPSYPYYVFSILMTMICHENQAKKALQNDTFFNLNEPVQWSWERQV